MSTFTSSLTFNIKTFRWQVSIIIPDINEKAIRTDDPLKLPLEVARAKADEIFRKLSSSDRNGKECVVITADQVVMAINNEIREKVSILTILTISTNISYQQAD